MLFRPFLKTLALFGPKNMRLLQILNFASTIQTLLQTYLAPVYSLRNILETRLWECPPG